MSFFDLMIKKSGLQVTIDMVICLITIWQTITMRLEDIIYPDLLALATNRKLPNLWLLVLAIVFWLLSVLLLLAFVVLSQLEN
jgi:hypothetical protein